MATLADVIDRLKKEGELNRNSGTNSNKTIINEIDLTNVELGRIKNILSGAQDYSKEPPPPNDADEEQVLALQDIAYQLDSFNSKIEDYIVQQQFAQQEMAESMKENAVPVTAAGGAATSADVQQAAGGFSKSAILAGVVGVAALAGVAAIIAGFLNFDATAVKNNVLELLSISDAAGGNLNFLIEGGVFFNAMTGLGLGLAAFSLGQGIAGLAGGMTAVLENFTDLSWAGGIKRSVLTLLSIGEDAGGNLNFILDSAGFLAAMTMLATGLAAFSLGQGVAAIGGGMSAVLENFTDGTWAGNIKRSVLTLLSIKDELGGNLNMLLDSGGFVAAMGMIGAGLIAFAFGEGATATSGMAQEALSFFTGQDMVTGIKQKVLGLLEIGEMTNAAQLGDFVGTMTMLAAGLAVFGGGEFFSAIGRGAGALVDWLSGTENPLTTVKYLVDNQNAMLGAADATRQVAYALQEFNNVDLSDFKADINGVSQSLHRLRSDSVMFNVGTNLIASAATVGGEGPAMSFNINAPTTASGGTTLNVVGGTINSVDVVNSGID
jgi:hypothetical protein